MDPASEFETASFPERYRAFVATIAALRPALHRYCARMIGSVIDGEDVVQEVLFEAYRKLDHYDERRPLKPWLFRIAHNRSVDFLRRRGVRREAETESAGANETFAPSSISPSSGVGHAVEHLVISLPPKERACVLLKEVFGYSLEEVAELVDSTVGGVKAALNRGRTKLAASVPPAGSGPAPAPSPNPDPAIVRLMTLYVERFNRRDWDGVRELIRADARLRVADRFAGRFVEGPYLPTYERWPMPWKMAVGEVDGEPVVIVLKLESATATPYAAIRLEVIDQRIARIVDYLPCPWIISAARSVSITTPG